MWIIPKNLPISHSVQDTGALISDLSKYKLTEAYDGRLIALIELNEEAIKKHITEHNLEMCEEDFRDEVALAALDQLHDELEEENLWIIPKNLPISHSVQDTGALISDLSKLSELCEPSLMWRSKVSASKTWLRRLKQGRSIPRLSSRTLKPSHSRSFVTEWTSYQGASLVNHLVVQEDEQETKTLDTCGLTSCEASETWDDLPLFSSRMLRGSSPQSSSPTSGPTPKERPFCSMSLGNWREWVTTQRREYSQRVKSAHPIDASASSLWVCAPISESQGALLFQGCLRGSEAQLGLQNQVQVQPTPPQEAQNNTHGNRPASQWATPNTMDYLPQRSKEALVRQATIARKGRTAPANLREQVNPEAVAIYINVSQWATPTSRDYKGKYPQWIQEDPNKQTRNLLPDQAHGGTYKGKLNPRWVETLMGLPVGWVMPSCVNPWIIEQTSCGCLGTESCQTPQSERSGNCGDLWATPPASQRGDTVEVYLRKSLNRILKGGAPFAPTLQVAVLLGELGLSTSTVDLFQGLDLSLDIESITRRILND